MMKQFRRIGAMVCALVMTLGMSSVAFAADMNGTGGAAGRFTEASQAVVQGDTITLYKEIVAVNPDGSEIYAPEVSYGYEITSAEEGKMITDAQGVKAVTKAGPEGASITNSVSWTNEEKMQTSEEGAANRKEIVVSFENVEWKAAGVYRYKITEIAPNYEASGLTKGAEDHIRFLDVYVKDAEEGFEIYGYVCFAENTDIDAGNETAAQKTEGFVNTESHDADRYYTFNLDVTKDVVNDRAMENHDFPFFVTFTAAESLNIENIRLDAIANGDASLGSNYDGSLTEDAPKLQDNGKVSYIGIPYATKIEIHENVNVAGTTYQVTSKGADENVDQVITGTMSGVDSKNAVIDAQTIEELAAKKVDFTNEMLLISPTGVVLRVAPYVLMLGAGLALVIFSRRRRMAR